MNETKDKRKLQLVTLDDMDNFRADILAAIKDMLAFAKGPPVKRWVKAAEARKLIGVSPGKLQVIRDSGLLSFTKIGGNIYYDKDDLIKLFEENKVQRRK
ncbi:DNA-binding protein [Mucilaginibacter limnophilus]|uniref:DNA-binding protein n=1 Tax=Mucilaginibacter limnophilus TaxID=1932778 RepID=A0A437MWP4_9SPHI|nr:helix-turn-helix domain-containing protein [Mucilaginibacter limnophilus]RVU02091.1 DNA-binding protein [Mucilaginibacter limnophilus]